MTHRVPSAPFLARIDREADLLNWTASGPDTELGGLDKVCERIGFSTRRVRHWRSAGELTFDAADRVLTRLNLEHHWHEPELAPYYEPPEPAPAPKVPWGEAEARRRALAERLDEWQPEEAA